MNCTYCNKEAEVRPYGKNMSLICFDCAMLPENFEVAEQQFAIQFEAAIEEAKRHGGTVIVGEETGPRPYFDGE